jgi:tricorn protease
MQKLVSMAWLLMSPAASLENFAAPTVTGILRFPTVNKTQVAFVYAGDIWIVSRNGGTASRLTNLPGPENNPRFSPDGLVVAFTGTYNGVYTIPVAGGQANRVTHNSGTTTVCSWTPDGRVLFMTDGFSHIFDGDGQARVRQLFTIGVNGGLPQKLPVPYGANGAISADGEWLAYTPYAEGLTEKRKHYFGGFAPDIWLFNLRDHQSRQITDWKGADTSPMWWRATVYYLSDGGAEARMNIWAYDTRTGARRQVTHFKDFDVKWPSIGPGANDQGEIVFNYGTDLYLLDLASDKSRKVEVRLPKDLAPETFSVDASKFIVNWKVSAEGDRAVVEARGDIWTVAPEGAKRRLTTNSGAAERDPSFSPDGRWIAFFSDASGEYELYVVSADGSSAPRQVTRIGPGFRYRPLWSPDSRHIAFHDNFGSIYLHTIESGGTKQIDRDPLVSRPQISWSPNSRWIAYARGAQGSPRYTAIWLYSLEEKKTHQVTSGSFNDSWPVFDREGDYLFFVSTRNFYPPTFDPVDYNNFIYPLPDAVLATPLRSDVGLPWAPVAHKAGEPGRIELQNFEYRAQPAVLNAPGRYSNLAVGADGQLVFTFTGRDGKTSIRLVNFKEGREAKTILEGFENFELSSNGKKLAVRQDNNVTLVDPVPNQKLERQIKIEDMKVEINSRTEGRQIFQDAWRLYRDNFYDEKMRGVDWPAVRARYAKLLDAVSRREDYYEVIGEMLGELGSSHLFVFPPADAQPSPEPERTGSLAVEFEIDRGAYRIAKIYDSAANDPYIRHFLRRSGVDVNEGEYLLAVNGAALDTKQDPWVAFKGLAGKTATLTISSKPALDQAARQVSVIVRDRSYEVLLRNVSWVEANRAYVERKTNGKAGYIYLADTHDWGSKEFTRQLNFQLDKQALIIDARWNEGGHVPFHILEVLGRQRYLYFRSYRRPMGGRTPDFLHEGPLALLTNGVAYSGGDELAELFRRRGLGKIIGTRTMGGMVGAGGLDIRFVDGGSSLVPIVGFYDDTGKWVVEGYGVEPDIKVIDDPALMLGGADPQLDKAIETMLEELKGSRTIPRVVAPSTADKGHGLTGGDNVGERRFE